MSDMSMTPTASRTATCSRRARSKEWPRPKAVSGVGWSGRSPAPANQSGNSQPMDTPKLAPWATSSAWMALRRIPRADTGSQLGNTESPNNAPSSSTVRSVR